MSKYEPRMHDKIILHYCPIHGRVDYTTVIDHPQRTHDCFYCKQMLIEGRRKKAKRIKES